MEIITHWISNQLHRKESSLRIWQLVHSARQEIPRLLWISKFHCSVHNLSHMTAVQSLLPYFVDNHFNIILVCMHPSGLHLPARPTHYKESSNTHSSTKLLTTWPNIYNESSLPQPRSCRTTPFRLSATAYSQPCSSYPKNQHWNQEVGHRTPFNLPAGLWLPSATDSCSSTVTLSS